MLNLHTTSLFTATKVSVPGLSPSIPQKHVNHRAPMAGTARGSFLERGLNNSLSKNKEYLSFDALSTLDAYKKSMTRTNMSSSMKMSLTNSQSV